MICSALQGLSKTKLIYISCATGLITKTLLDIPLIFLFNKLGIYPFYGAILATTIGYLLSLAIPLYTLHHKYNFSYKETLNQYQTNSNYCYLSNNMLNFEAISI